MSKVAETVSGLLFGRPEQPEIPEAKVPAAPAPSRRQDTGAQVTLGADAGKNARVSGNGRGSGDVLGSLGRSSLSI